MECHDVDELIDSFLTGELLVETNHEVLRHLDGCPACRAEVDARRDMRSAIRRAFTGASDLRMRDGFAAEVAARLRADAHGRTPRRPTRFWAAAASVILIFASGLFALQSRLAAMTRDAVGDHRDCAVQFSLAERPISIEDAAKRYDAGYRKLQASPADRIVTPHGLIRVVDRHSCVFDGRRFAHVVLRYNDQIVSLLVTRDRVALPDWAQPSGHRASSAGIAPFHVHSFRADGHLAFVVGAMDEAAIAEVTSAVADPVRAALLEG